EKAHPDIFNILLQVMDRGMLTDTNGREANFRNVILVMTTNAGAAQASRRSIGFTRQDHSTDAMEVIRKSFSPEFRNRLDAIVQFQPLGMEHVLRVVDKFLIELESQLDEKNVALTATPEARDWPAAHGFDPQMGARPLARVIQDKVKRPLGDELLVGRVVSGGRVSVDVRDDELLVEAFPEPEKLLPATVECPHGSRSETGRPDGRPVSFHGHDRCRRSPRRNPRRSGFSRPGPWRSTGPRGARAGSSAAPRRQAPRRGTRGCRSARPVPPRPCAGAPGSGACRSCTPWPVPAR